MIDLSHNSGECFIMDYNLGLKTISFRNQGDG